MGAFKVDVTSPVTHVMPFGKNKKCRIVSEHINYCSMFVCVRPTQGWRGTEDARCLRVHR